MGVVCIQEDIYARHIQGLHKHSCAYSLLAMSTLPCIYTLMARRLDSVEWSGGMKWWNELLEWNTGVPHLLPRLFEELRNSGTNIDGAEDRIILL